MAKSEGKREIPETKTIGINEPGNAATSANIGALISAEVPAEMYDAALANIDRFDAVRLFELAVACANQERYRRNGGMQQMVIAWQSQQQGIREHQGRLDARDKERREREAAAARAVAEAEAEAAGDGSGE